ncbi:MAG TPA: hypothetical protein VGM54_04520 [Chthoniobacter sp.]|jgi:hypothetical protein
MKTRAAFIVLVAIIALIATGLWFAYGVRQERKAKQDEKVLSNLVIGDFDVHGLTRDEAVELAVKKIHALGHPELMARVYSDPRQAPSFHAMLRGFVWPLPEEKITIRLTQIPVCELLKYIGGLTDSTCELIGHDLVVISAHGTCRPFRRETFRVYPDFFSMMTPKDLATFGEANGVAQYEGTIVTFNPSRCTVEIYGPDDSIELLKEMVPARPPLWEELQYELIHWERYPRTDY